MTSVSDLLPLAMLAAFLVGASKGGLPMVGALAVPILTFSMDALTAAALLLPIYMVSDVFGVWLYRRDFSRRNLAILIPAGLLGVLIGYLVAPYLSPPVLNGAVGCVGLSLCLRVWLGRAGSAPRPAKLGPGLFWGTLTGLTSFISHVGAPPFQTYVVPQKLPKLVFAGTSTILFAVINLAKLPPYLALDRFPEMSVTLVAFLVAVALVGTWSGARLTRIIPERLFFAGILVALFILSIQLVVRSATSLLGG